jgi:hypothetical protein
MTAFESQMPQGGSAALREASRFFVKEGPVWETLHALIARLSELKIPYAVIGGMALNAHGYVRMTIDVDVLVDPVGLAAVHRELGGSGYVTASAGSKHQRDVRTQVRIDFLVAGQFPGDGRPKPVPFPSPADAAVEIDGIRYLALPNLIELKLASGMTNPGRLKDLGDVQELIRVLKLPSNFADQLHEYVRAKYHELWQGVAADGGELE